MNAGTAARWLGASTLLLGGTLSAGACAPSERPVDLDEAQEALNGQVVLCDATELPGLHTRVFRSATSDAVFYALPEKWHVVEATTHDFFLQENADTATSRAAAARSPFFKETYFEYRLRWSTYEPTDAIVAALRAGTGLASIELRELASISPGVPKATVFVEPADLVSSKMTMPGKDVVTRMLVRNTFPNGIETNEFVEAFAAKKGIVGLNRGFSYQCVPFEGGAASVRSVGFRAGIAPSFGAFNEIQYDAPGIDVHNDADLPLLSIQLLGYLDRLGPDFASFPAGRQEWATVQSAYIDAGWAEWRSRAMAQFQSDVAWGGRWESSGPALDEIRQKASELRKELETITQAGANAIGSNLSPRAFVGRGTQSSADVYLAGVLDDLDRLATFADAHHTRPFLP
jgi:hypothetical protein